MRKSYLYIALIVLLTGISQVFPSCGKLISIPQQPTTEISEAAVFADSTDLESAIAGVYTSFNVLTSVNINSGATTIYTGLMGDELVNVNSASTNYQPFFQNAIIPSLSFPDNTLWTPAYKTIYLINACISGVAASTGISASLKNQTIGEMEVCRALCYFNMVNLFGGVPLVTSTDYNATKSQPRASIDSVYALIISDLTDAASRLSDQYPSAGRARPNSYTANALLAKVFLYVGQWSQAQNAATTVIGSGLYSLNTDPTTVFQDGSNEAIWQLPANGLYSQTIEGETFIPYPGGIPNFTMTTTLLNAFETGDLRAQSWLDTTNVNGITYIYPLKYKNSITGFRPPSPQEDYMIFRLADIYLIRAEALAEQGQTTAALTDLNQVRSRALLSPATAGSQTDLLNKIMHERQIELFCEWGNRWFDLKRTGTINTVLSAEKPNWVSADTVLPIPQAELQTNPFLKQNPGY